MINKDEESKRLTERDKVFIDTMQSYGARMDELYGKPIQGAWLPFGPKRNPITEEQKNNWRELCESHMRAAENGRNG